MKELPSRMRPNRYKRPTLINLTDEDARLMKSRQGVVPGYNAKAVVSPLATDKGISSMLVTPRMWWISSMTPPALSDAAHIIPDSEPEGSRSSETVFLCVGCVTRHLTATSSRCGPTTSLRYAPIS